MPCTGPNKDFSDIQAKKAIEEIFALLAKNYGVGKHCPFGFFEKDLNRAKLHLTKAVEELFWADACDTF